MSEIKSISFALSPNDVPAFLLDWELTKKCNLDCSYCPTGLEWGGHDNSIPHPPLEDCLKTINFMYEYVDLYMQHKKPTQRKVVLNVYGGESLFHPDIKKILQECRNRYSKYKNNWELTITTTTNAVINKSIWRELIPLIDEFTVSYHAENLPKQEKLFFENLLQLKKHNKRVKCIVMMHIYSDLWHKSLKTIEFCKKNNIRYLPKSLDTYREDINYSKDQFDVLKTFWVDGISPKNNIKVINAINELGSDVNKISSICEGRACCGGRKLALNNDLKSSVSFVPQQGFMGWTCSVNWFFLFVQQASGFVYNNKDCRTNLDNNLGPLGNLSNTQEMIDDLKTRLEHKTLTPIKCIKTTCMCGYCAPKAENLQDFKDLIKRNVITDVINFPD